jgi:adenylate cyclase
MHAHSLDRGRSGLTSGATSTTSRVAAPGADSDAEMSSTMSVEASTEIVTVEPAARPRLTRARSFLFGPPLPSRLPERVQDAILEEQQTSEILVTLLQLLAIVTFAILYTLSPKGFPPSVPFEPVPVTLTVYAAFTLVRLWLAWQRRLKPWFLALSVIVDITMLMVTIWSFYLQYEEPPAIYLKAPTLMYAFILIALRTLRFEPWLVMLAGLSAAAGWLCLVAYAVIAEGGAEITHSFATYATSYQILLGAEFDKVVSLLMVTAILAIGLLRARKLLFRAVADQLAAAELSRFFAPEVAGRIRESDIALEPGQAELREAAVLMVDLRGFTPLSQRLAPDEVMRLLSEYQSRVIAAVTAHGGSIDKFMGDGILASFGAIRPSPSFAADALRAVEDLLEACAAWAGERRAAGLPAPPVGAAVATGPVMCGTIGDRTRLEYTVIGEPVNLAAKLEKHTKAEQARALCTAETYQLALAQDYRPGTRHESRAGRTVAGVDAPLELMILA